MPVLCQHDGQHAVRLAIDNIETASIASMVQNQLFDLFYMLAFLHVARCFRQAPKRFTLISIEVSRCKDLTKILPDIGPSDGPMPAEAGSSDWSSADGSRVIFCMS